MMMIGRCLCVWVCGCVRGGGGEKGRGGCLSLCVPWFSCLFIVSRREKGVWYVGVGSWRSSVLDFFFFNLECD